MGGVGAEIGAPDHERERERRAKGAALSAVGTRGSGPGPAACRIKWTGRELESLAQLVSAGEANRPTDALIRAMRD